MVSHSYTNSIKKYNMNDYWDKISILSVFWFIVILLVAVFGMEDFTFYLIGIGITITILKPIYDYFLKKLKKDEVIELPQDMKQEDE